MECRASKNKDYFPVTFRSKRAALNGLFRESYATYIWSKPHGAGEHGYSLIPFAKYLEIEVGWKPDF